MQKRAAVWLPPTRARRACGARSVRRTSSRIRSVSMEVDLPGWAGEGVALLLGLHRRWPPVGYLVRNWEVRVGIWDGERRRAAVRPCLCGAELNRVGIWNGFVGTDGGDGML